MNIKILVHQHHPAASLHFSEWEMGPWSRVPPRLWGPRWHGTLQTLGLLISISQQR